MLGQTQNIQTKTKDGVPLKVGHIPTAEKMFFFERLKDGFIFSEGEKRASSLIVRPQIFKYLGMTDGVDYANAIKDVQGRFQTLTMQERHDELIAAFNREAEKSRLTRVSPQLKPLNMNMPDQIQLKGTKDEVL